MGRIATRLQGIISHRVSMRSARTYDRRCSKSAALLLCSRVAILTAGTVPQGGRGSRLLAMRIAGFAGAAVTPLEQAEVKLIDVAVLIEVL